jgi:hypothetical protein
MEMYINGAWIDAPQRTTITSAFTGEVVDTGAAWWSPSPPSTIRCCW